MSRFVMILISIIILAVLALLIFFATADIPAPSAPVERTLPDDRFPS